MTKTAAGTRAKLDQVCADAVGLARGAVLEETPGEHLEVVAEGERAVTHFFEASLPGYEGWRWAVTVARAPRSRHVTICETVLLPGPDALVAPAWVPWQDRLQPGDLGVGDLMPTAPDDDRLAPGYLLSDDPAVEEVNWELGLGRVRVMSREGRIETAQRWYDGDQGPSAPIATAAPRTARCVACGFYLPLAGALRQGFGACGNLFAPDDGRVVSADHGCGAHSEVLVEVIPPPVEELPTVYDDSEVDPVADELPGADADDSGSVEVEAAAEVVEGEIVAEEPEAVGEALPEVIEAEVVSDAAEPELVAEVSPEAVARSAEPEVVAASIEPAVVEPEVIDAEVVEPEAVTAEVAPTLAPVSDLAAASDPAPASDLVEPEPQADQEPAGELPDDDGSRPA